MRSGRIDETAGVLSLPLLKTYMPTCATTSMRAFSIIGQDRPVRCDEGRSRAVVSKLDELWPEVPVSHLILTHHHFDHMGGDLFWSLQTG